MEPETRPRPYNWTTSLHLVASTTQDGLAVLRAIGATDALPPPLEVGRRDRHWAPD